MNKRFSLSRALRAVCAAAVCAVAADFAAAQANQDDEVVVEAVRERTVGRTSTGMPVKEISITRRVSYADLDLTVDADTKKLEERIRDNAKSACRELDQKHPLSEGDTGKSCLETAVEKAMDDAQVAIEEAKRSKLASDVD